MEFILLPIEERDLPQYKSDMKKANTIEKRNTAKA